MFTISISKNFDMPIPTEATAEKSGQKMPYQMSHDQYYYGFSI